MASVASNRRKAQDLFERRWGGVADYVAAAPGRVNLIGEHVDYSEGFVLPLALQFVTVVVGRPRDDNLCRVATSNATPHVCEFSAASLEPSPGGSWDNYVRGVVAQYRKEHPDLPLGFDMAIHSDVPLGSGLSSSASLEVAVATFIEAMRPDTATNDVDKALRCQKAEHEFPGTQCGIMDQFISALAVEGHALLIDCRTHTSTPVPLTDPGLAVVVINSDKPHQLEGSEYNDRRKQVEEAVSRIQASRPDIASLRDADMSDLTSLGLPPTDVVFRRARHVLTEDIRTARAVKALKDGDYAKVGECMFQSHDSLATDFEVSTPALDLLVTLCKDKLGPGGLYGARMTGGGFGGCIVALVKASAAKDIIAYVAGKYKEATGIDAPSYITKPGKGAHVVAKPDPGRERARWVTVGIVAAMALVAAFQCPKVPALKV